ncbi:conjugative transposon protein TraK [Parabacteroides merdae]|jgi:conjugative transposon TraK protein|uniref:conjugative transposon protein TraK n=1 Tax=Parabacteroides merdae TaxID=46503 RepID=UPI0034A31B73
MFIKNIEEKQRLVLTTCIIMGLVTVITCLGSVIYADYKISSSEDRIYVLDANYNAFSAMRSNGGLTMEMEVKGLVEDFHSLFYTLGPDNEFIKRNMERANHLCDQSGYRQYMNMRERGFYNELVQNNMHSWLMTDSIKFDRNRMEFRYSGTIRFDRRDGHSYYKLITSGKIQVQPRTENNIHGLMIRNWIVEDYSAMRSASGN